MAGTIARGEVRLYRFQTPDKERPVVVLTRNSAIAYLSAVTVAPVPSTMVPAFTTSSCDIVVSLFECA